MTNTVLITDLGTDASYENTLEVQRITREKLIEGAVPQTIFFCEHPPTITLGRGADAKHLLHSREKLESLGYKVFDIERGGEVTYHGPGQIVCYPILDLNLLKRDISWYMRSLEEVVLAVIRNYGIEGERVPEQAGVWLSSPKRKVASVGVHMSRWRSMHGLALNYLPQQSKFSVINPCGFTDIGITSVQEEASKNKDKISYKNLCTLLEEAITEVFKLAPLK
jgi:lipoate-protein ligase B